MLRSTVAYAAGVFDGEGSVEIYYDLRKTPTAKSGKIASRQGLSVQMCSEQVIRFFEINFGGKVNFLASRTTERRDYFRWRITGKESVEFAKRILPYSILKARQLELYIEYHGLLLPKGARGISELNHQRREEIRDEVWLEKKTS